MKCPTLGSAEFLEASSESLIGGDTSRDGDMHGTVWFLVIESGGLDGAGGFLDQDIDDCMTDGGAKISHAFR
jgi:hypothetical protein